MLYHLFEYLDLQYDLPGAGVFQFLTFRAGFAIILSLLISMVFGSRIIQYLKSKQIGETVRELGLQGQKEKEGTPTMGGIIIALSVLIPSLLLADLSNVYIILLLVTTVWMCSIGLIDDYIKVFRKNKDGLKGKFKILGQVVLGIVIACVMLFNDGVTVRMTKAEAVENHYEILSEYRSENGVTYTHVRSTITNVPFFKDNKLDYSSFLWFLGGNSGKFAWIIFIPLVIFIVTAVSNAANITDGIDGLATGISAIIGGTLGILAYVSGNTLIADYLNILYLPNTGELLIFSACFMGACIGFLWYNSYPARVFMGDTGSLMLGGIIAVLAIAIRKELLIPLLCGIFLVENLSVVIQVAYFKYTKKKYGEGRRVFKMAPLHHHFQKLKMHESKIVTRFWIVGILLAVMTIVTLKIR